MSLLASCAPSRWGDFLNIPDCAMPNCTGEDVDLFVGKNKSVKISLKNGTVTKFRDVVVLGKLILTSVDTANTVEKPKLIARDFFAPGTLKSVNVHVKSRKFMQPKNIETFRRELQELFLEWMNFQRESVAQIGLRSVLM